MSLRNRLFSKHLDFHCLSSFHCMHRPRLSCSSERAGATLRCSPCCSGTRFASWACQQERIVSYLPVACNSSCFSHISSITATLGAAQRTAPCCTSTSPAGTPLFQSALESALLSTRVRWPFPIFSEIASFCNVDHYRLKDEIGALVLTGMLSKGKLHLSQQVTNTVTSNCRNKILRS